MKEIPLTRGMVTLVDDDVYEWASQFNWQARRKGRKFYATRGVWDPIKKNNRHFSLHREIMNPGPDEEVDHKFGDTLDNRRSEMQVVSGKQNRQRFKLKRELVTSRFRGVCWNSRDRTWAVNLSKDGVRVYRGSFSNEGAAAAAYNQAALQHFGEFAQLNKI